MVLFLKEQTNTISSVLSPKEYKVTFGSRQFLCHDPRNFILAHIAVFLSGKQRIKMCGNTPFFILLRTIAEVLRGLLFQGVTKVKLFMNNYKFVISKDCNNYTPNVSGSF